MKEEMREQRWNVGGQKQNRVHERATNLEVLTEYVQFKWDYRESQMQKKKKHDNY